MPLLRKTTMLLRLSRRWATCLAIGAACAMASAQVLPDDPLENWVEAEAPPPPAFNLDKLVEVTVDAQGNLRYGIDPATIQIGKDGVVRYVIVARSTTGAMTAMYEGLRCTTGEYKLYARYNVERWNAVSSPEWRSLWESSRVRHPLAFARQGGCDSKAPPSTVQDIVRQLRAPGVTVYPS